MTNDDIELALLLEQNKDNIRFAKTLVLDDTGLTLGGQALTDGQEATIREQIGADSAYVPGDNAGGRANIYSTLRLDVSDDGGISNPKLEFKMANAYWRMGGDNANGTPGTDFVPLVLVSAAGSPVQDNIYCSFQGTAGNYPTDTNTTIVRYGFGVTPPSVQYRLQTAGGTTGVYPEVGGFSSLVRAGQTGNAIAVKSSSGTDRWWIDSTAYMSGEHTSGSAIAIKAESTNGRPLLLSKNDGSAAYYFQYSGNSMRFVYGPSATNLIQFDAGGAFRHLGTSLGFFSAAAVTKPVVTGSVGGNAALSSLISALATLGLITNNTTA